MAAGLLARAEFAWSAVAAVLLAVAVVAAGVGALLGRVGQRGLSATLIAASGALGVLGGWTAADAYVWGGMLRLAVVAAVVVLMLLLLGWYSPLGRGGLVGAAAVAAVTVAWECVAAVQEGAVTAQEQARTGAVLAVFSVVLVGVLPRIALGAAGMTALDDRRAGGTSVSRYRVATALGATHRGLALATVVTAASAAVAGVLVLREATVWTVLLASVTALVLLLRARAFPLIVEVVALLLAGAAVAWRLLAMWAERSGAYGALGVLVVLAVIPLAVLAVHPAEHVRVRLRRMGDALESLGVIALFPLLIGVFGVYGRLLGTFA